MLNIACEHVSDGLDAAVRMPRKAGAILFRPVIAEIVEQQKRIELGGVSKAERAAQVHAGALDGRLGRDDAFHGPDGHGRTLLCDALINLCQKKWGKGNENQEGTQVIPVYEPPHYAQDAIRASRLNLSGNVSLNFR